MIFIKFYLVFISFLCLLFSLIVGSEYYFSGNIIYLLVFLFLAPIFFQFKRISFTYNELVYLFIFLIVGSISSIYNADIQLFFSSVFLVIMVCFSNKLNGFYSFDFIEKIFFKYGVMFLVFFTIFIVFSKSDYSIPYLGIYENPNTMGAMASSVLMLLIGLFFSFFEQKDKNYIIISLLIFVIILFINIVLITVSRLAIMAAISLFLILFFLFNVRMFFRKKNIFKFNLVIILITLIFSYFLSKNSQDVMEKFIIKESGGDVFDGRSYIWKKTLDDAGFWGNGSNYFLNEFALGAHNTFISILGRYGYIYFFIILLFWLFLGFKSFKFLMRNTVSFYTYMYFTVWYAFTFLSMTEVMLYTPIMIIFVLSMCGMNRNWKL